MYMKHCPNGHLYDVDKYSVCPYCTTKPKEEARESFGKKGEDTVGFFQNAIGVDPVTGWMVCIAGNYFGESFKLKAGKNFIGRSNEMDLMLASDPYVEMQYHATVIYDPRSRQFSLVPGKTKTLVCCNDQPVSRPVYLYANDIITVGKCKLMLIPCCSRKFSWEDWM